MAMIRIPKLKAVSPLLVVFSLAAGCDDSGKMSKVSYPEPDSPGARLLLEKCGICHAPPQPSSHVAKIWPGVLQRMQMRMTSKGQSALQPQELGVLLDYLQRHAGVTEK